jgi:Glycine zipper 2TM domain
MKMNKTMTSLVLAATAITGLSAAPAAARHHDNDGYYDRAGYYHSNNDRYESRDDRGYQDDRRYDRGYQDDRGYSDDRYYRSNNRCSKGTGGLIIGGAAGGLLGNTVARRGDKTTGTIIGAAVGALAGRALDKASSRCR